MLDSTINHFQMITKNKEMTVTNSPLNFQVDDMGDGSYQACAINFSFSMKNSLKISLV